MADITLTYKGNTILELNDSAEKSIKTAGKYLEDDIGLSYVKSGSAGEVIFQQYKGQDSGSTQTISTTYTVTTAGYYYLSSGGWLDAVSLTVNGTELQLTSFSEYSKFRKGIMQLNVGDIITINTYGSGRLAIHGLIIFLY